MKVQKLILIIIILLVSGFSQTVVASEIDSYYGRNFFLTAPSTVHNDGLAGFANPANLALSKSVEHYFFWSTDGLQLASFDNWGFYNSLGNIGFGLQRLRTDTNHLIDYNLSLGFGNRAQTFGIGYGWATGDTEIFNRQKILSLGTISRPFNFISLGLLERISLENNWSETVMELGIRPLGTSQLTIFGDAALQNGMSVSDMPFSAGAIVMITEGINLTGRYFDDKSFNFSLNINFGQLGIGSRTDFNTKKELSGYSYHIRIGRMRPSVFPEKFNKNKKYLPLSLKGKIDYNKYTFFDTGTLRFYDILKNIKAAVDDARISVVAVNLSSMRVRPEQAWEIRRELEKARELNKKIIVFIDRASMTSYHLASVADKIILDPIGSITLYGYLSGRTYFKGTLDKIGIGYDEWRFFKYKSAAEVLSREEYSAAAREQAQDYVDDRYEFTRDDICRARNFTDEQFDNLVNNHTYFTANAALNEGLIDTLGRWSDRKKIIFNLTGSTLGQLSSNQLMSNTVASDQWGELPKIAIVYGLGECEMDSGIRARWLEGVFLGLSKNYSVKAVVFRVDSPGGDGMASDLVAEALKKCARNKPVIVSQGQVAGSGGYWISIYGDKIIAGPNTVTGSIGVIGGWIYDIGIGNKIGMTSDFVKRGTHADVEFGIRIPYVGYSIPSRNLTTQERYKVEEVIRLHYKDFVDRVADGRNMTVEQIENIAQGHYYSGIRGKELGLIDEIGGLIDAIAIAKTEAGLEIDEQIKIIEIPKSKGMFDLKSKFMPSLITAENDPVVKYIQMNLEHSGQFLPMMTPGTYPEYEQ